MYLKGWLQVDIADELNIDQSTVSRDLKAMQKGWLASALVDFDKAKGKELAKIDRLEREYWIAWERSVGKSERVIIKGKGTISAATEKTTTTDDLNGDPRYLAGIQWCIDKRCKILGIESPERTLGMNIDLSQLNESQIERLADGEGTLHVLATPGTS